VAVNKELTFLILEDDEDSRFLTQYALKRGFPGCRFIECTTPDDALVQAQGHRLDGIVTDHHLGTQEGDTFMRQLRAIGIACPVVMVTASSDPAVYRRAYAAGAAHVFANDDRDFVAFFRSRLAQ